MITTVYLNLPKFIQRGRSLFIISKEYSCYAKNMVHIVIDNTKNVQITQRIFISTTNCIDDN